MQIFIAFIIIVFIALFAVMSVPFSLDELAQDNTHFMPDSEA